MEGGWTTTREAQHYHRADDPAAAARYAVTPAAVYEALTMSMKRARGEGSGLTPFEILERAVSDKEAQEVAKAAGQEFKPSPWIARWREYVGETMGCRQAVTSQGLTLEPLKMKRMRMGSRTLFLRPAVILGIFLFTALDVALHLSCDKSLFALVGNWAVPASLLPSLASKIFIAWCVKFTAL